MKGSDSECREIIKGQVEVFGVKEPWTYARDGWQKKLLEETPEFDGNITNAVEFLFQMARGEKATIDDFRGVGQIITNPPLLGVASGERAKQMSVLRNKDQGIEFILISVYYLNNLSRLNFEKIGWVSWKGGRRTYFHGYLKDLGFLIGVEETDHAFYFQVEKSLTYSLEPSSVPMDEYDAQDHEHRALLLQRKMAIKEKMPPETISFLDERIGKAEEFRKAREEKNSRG